MKAWVLGNWDRCEVIAPKKFRDEVQSAVMEGDRKYGGNIRMGSIIENVWIKRYTNK